MLEVLIRPDVPRKEYTVIVQDAHYVWVESSFCWGENGNGYFGPENARTAAIRFAARQAKFWGAQRVAWC
jgi:hypothetical protein